MKSLELVAIPIRAMRRAAFSWAIALGLVIFATIAFWPAFRGSALDQVMDQLPTGLVQALGLQDFGTPAGYLRGNLYELLVPLLAAVAGVLIAIGATASDEDAGRLELLLTQPVRRGSVFVARALATAMWLSLIGLAVLGAQALSDWLFDLQIDGYLLTSTVTLSFLLAALHAALAFAVAGLTARPGLVLAVGMGVAIFGYLVAALFPLSDTLAQFARLSPWNWAFAGDPLVNAAEAWRYLALAIPALVLVLLGTLAFNRRDVTAA